jgi:polysaccharide export outer membrane protein
MAGALASRAASKLTPSQSARSRLAATLWSEANVAQIRPATLGVLLAALMVGACGGSRPPATAELSPPPPSEYVIGAGDVLNVVVYRMPELTVSLPVRPDGRLSVPLVPDIEASGKTPSQLASEIETQLRKFVREPNVTVLVQSFVGPPDRQIRVIGEATQPLAIPYREGMTVLDVMIQARGLTRYAAGNRAEIIRRVQPNGPNEVIPVRLNSLLRDGNIAEDVVMRPGDTLVIPQGWF